jgi:hypothetical protein
MLCLETQEVACWWEQRRVTAELAAVKSVAVKGRLSSLQTIRRQSGGNEGVEFSGREGPAAKSTNVIDQGGL